MTKPRCVSPLWGTPGVAYRSGVTLSQVWTQRLDRLTDVFPLLNALAVKGSVGPDACALQQFVHGRFGASCCDASSPTVGQSETWGPCGSVGYIFARSSASRSVSSSMQSSAQGVASSAVRWRQSQATRMLTRTSAGYPVVPPAASFWHQPGTRGSTSVTR